MMPLVIGFFVIMGASVMMFTPNHTVLGWILTVVWSLPAIPALVGLTGAVPLQRRAARVDEDAPSIVGYSDGLITVVPTVGRHDTYPALERAVLSYVHCLPAHLVNVRVDIVTEEGCEAAEEIAALAAGHPMVRVVTVPRDYQTRNGTRFKARANHYAHELRLFEGEARDDVWILHMDDDTGVGPDTAAAIARFINRQRTLGGDALHLAQGILTYPRENSVNWLTWLADSVRPADDFARFRALTGSGSPVGGLHGELLLIRSSIEATIGWDFGPNTIVEDAQFALVFCTRYPGRSGWFNGRCFGASPATVRDFLKQRERWCWGLLALALNKGIPLRHRLFLGVCLPTWIFGPLQHIAVILTLAMLTGQNTSPVWQPILVFWALSFGYVIWMYWEGLRLNAISSADRRRRWYEPFLVILLIPLFSMMEGLGGIRGLIKTLRRTESAFVVISKPS